MSVLESLTSPGGETESPSPSRALVQPRARLRTTARRGQSEYRDRMRAAEREQDGEDEDEEDEEVDDEDIGEDEHESEDHADDGADEANANEHDEYDDESPEKAKRRRTSSDEQEHDTPEGGKRYEFRERHSLKKPQHFDDNLYADLYLPLHQYNERESNGNARRRPRSKSRHRKRRKQNRSSAYDEEEPVRRPRGRARKRARSEEDEQDHEDVNSNEDDDFASDSSDMDRINRRIAAQERAEKEAADAAQQRPRSTRYALRNRDSEDGQFKMAIMNGKSSRRGSHDDHAGESHESGNDEEIDEGEDEDEEGDEDEEEGQESVEDESTGRYNLRHRQSVPDEHRLDYEDHSRARARSDRATRATRRSTRSGARRHEDISSVEAEDTGPRYSLRDRSKVQRVVEEVPTKDPSHAAYAEYSKRRSNGAAAGALRTSRSGFLSNRNRNRSSRHHHEHRRKRRHQRSRSSSPSSSSSDSETYKYYDSDEGGMRTNSGGRGRTNHNPLDRKRADITPVEIDRSVTWDSIGGLEKHIEALKEMVMLPLLYPEFYAKYNISPPSGVLFYGPPGTGKTLLARALANSCSVEDEDAEPVLSIDGMKLEERKSRHVTFYMRKGADCLSKWVGEAERQLRLLFEEAKRHQPSIIFFDEIDGLAPVRSAKQDQIHASIVSTLLALMDGMDARGRVVVIGATNRLDAIDPALRRPGRFDRELGFKLPNVTERRKMLQIHTGKWDPSLSDAFVSEIAEKTVGYCGADIKALCAEAALCSLRRVYPQVYGSQDKLLIQLERIIVNHLDFAAAMKKITPASHRTVSSFAAPLPRTVKTLLQFSLTSLMQSLKQRFPQFPIDIDSVGNPAVCASDATTSQGEDDEEEDDDIFAIKHHSDCDVCHGEQGELLCCAMCPATAHHDCISDGADTDNVDAGKDHASSSAWICPECRDSSDDEPCASKHAQLTKHRQARQFFSMSQQFGFPRILITGVAGMGQQFVGAALLHVLEGLTHFSLDYPSLVADTNAHHPEEALIRRLNEAQKCLPCVLYLPQVELWWENTTESMHVVLKMMLMSLQIKANLPILFLACTSKTCFEDLPQALQDLFSNDQSIQHTSIVHQLRDASEAERLAHFAQAFDAFATPPLKRRKRKRDDALEVLPLAPVVNKTREPTLAELQRIRERDMHCLRELRIFLGQVLDYCATQKSYVPFLYPVDPAVVPDYYVIIDNPMDLSTMREKLNDGDYTSFEQFLDDLQLIVQNANMFNPKRSATRHIAHAAGTMKDNVLSFAHRFRKHQGYDLFAKCREITKRLHMNPGFYSGFDDTPPSSLRRNQHSSPVKPAIPPSRSSARLKGIKAPEVPLEMVVKRARHEEKASSAVESASHQKEEDRERGNSVDEDDTAEQWFGGASNASAQASEEDDGTRITDVSHNSADSNGALPDDQEEEDMPVFAEGDRVVVQPRSYPGVNKQGGAGRIVRCHDDNTYDVKYVLGGSERHVAPKYISPYSDDSIQEAVIHHHQRSQATPTPTEQKVVEVKPPSKEELQMDFFFKLVWPILDDEGWTRKDVTEVDDDGIATTTAMFQLPRTDEDEERVMLEGVAAVIAHVKRDDALSVKCFGRRYSEKLLTNEVFDESQAQGGEQAVPDASTTTASADDSSPPAAEKCIEASTPPEETSRGDSNDQAIEEPPAFIYDETRMAISLKLLATRTAGWTMEALRDELLVLNKLAYPYRFQFDRTELMERVEQHVQMLGQ